MGEAHLRRGRAQNVSVSRRRAATQCGVDGTKLPSVGGNKGTKALPETQVHAYLDASVSHGDPFLLCESGFAGSDELSPRPLMLTNFTPK